MDLNSFRYLIYHSCDTVNQLLDHLCSPCFETWLSRAGTTFFSLCSNRLMGAL